MSEKQDVRPVQPTLAEWQRLIGTGVKTPNGDWGNIVKRAGDWDTAERRGWFIVAVPGRGQQVFHICELQLL